MKTISLFTHAVYDRITIHCSLFTVHYPQHRGLSGSTSEQIQAINPEFIKEAQIGQSLTPGRNNGFLNMLAVMKRKALELDAVAVHGGGVTATTEGSDGEGTGTVEEEGDRPIYNGILRALAVLKPTKMTLIDNSDKHAGHAGSKGYDGESHFELEIVAEAFEDLNLVKRHKLIYMLLGEYMPKIHALQIRANTPDEVQ